MRGRNRRRDRAVGRGRRPERAPDRPMGLRGAPVLATSAVAAMGTGTEAGSGASRSGLLEGSRQRPPADLPARRARGAHRGRAAPPAQRSRTRGPRRPRASPGPRGWRCGHVVRGDRGPRRRCRERQALWRDTAGRELGGCARLHALDSLHRRCALGERARGPCSHPRRDLGRRSEPHRSFERLGHRERGGIAIGRGPREAAHDHVLERSDVADDRARKGHVARQNRAPHADLGVRAEEPPRAERLPERDRDRVEIALPRWPAGAAGPPAPCKGPCPSLALRACRSRCPSPSRCRNRAAAPRRRRRR